MGESIFAGEGWGLFSDYGSAAECLEGPRRAHAVFKEHCGGMNKEHMIDGKNKSNLFECPFRTRNDGFYVYVISCLIPEIFKFCITQIR